MAGEDIIGNVALKSNDPTVAECQRRYWQRRRQR
jgi:hypothetical protein